MKPHRLLALAAILAFPALLQSGEPRSELFSSLRLVYEDDFGGGTIDPGHWQVRQGTTWAVKDGVLSGGPAPKEYQEKAIARNDAAHAGLKPVIWLEKVPERLVGVFRLRYDAADYHPRFPLIDVGHHIHTFTFGRDKTAFSLKKNEKTEILTKPLLPLNQWVDVVIELKPGVVVLKIDGIATRIEHEGITMAGQQQIDFKGVDHGAILIDRVALYEGIE